MTLPLEVPALPLPPEPPGDPLPPLDPWRFWAIVEIAGIGEKALRDAIDLIPDAAFKAIAKAKLTNPPGGKYNRNDPLFNNAFLMMQIGKTTEEVDALWAVAHSLPE